MIRVCIGFLLRLLHVHLPTGAPKQLSPKTTVHTNPALRLIRGLHGCSPNVPNRVSWAGRMAISVKRQLLLLTHS